MQQMTAGPDGKLQPSRSLPLSPLAVAGFASIGAGAIHAAAIGMHSEHTAAVVAFALTAAFQLGWGVVALGRANRTVALAGVAVNGIAIAAWIRAKSAGISVIDGLEEAEAVQLADGLAAALAAIATLAALLWLLKFAARRSAPRALLNAAALVVVALTLTGMIATGSHSHAGGDDHGAHGDDGHTGEAHTAGVAGDEHAAVAPTPYDPTQPIDLGGVEGVTPEQQARAENLIAVSLARLPQFADPAVAEANGFHSIGDAITGDEHYINWSYVNDEYILNPDYPESLVYQVGDDGQKFLAAAMFMLPDGTTLDQVPDLGGPLTQWHVHDDLCFTDDPVAPRLAVGRNLFTDDQGACRPPSVKKAAVPMIHVWITPHPCGPFAALEGVGAGQIREGEERLCDHAHGSDA